MHGIMTNADGLAPCAKGEQVRGAVQGLAVFKCIDTDTGLESCGYDAQEGVLLLLMRILLRWRVHVTKSIPSH
jgi:hypothetical protein